MSQYLENSTVSNKTLPEGGCLVLSGTWGSTDLVAW